MQVALREHGIQHRMPGRGELRDRDRERPRVTVSGLGVRLAGAGVAGGKCEQAEYGQTAKGVGKKAAYDGASRASDW